MINGEWMGWMGVWVGDSGGFVDILEWIDVLLGK